MLLIGNVNFVYKKNFFSLYWSLFKKSIRMIDHRAKASPRHSSCYNGGSRKFKGQVIIFKNANKIFKMFFVEVILLGFGHNSENWSEFSGYFLMF